MERKKYYGIMFCVVSLSKFVIPAQAGRKSPALQVSNGACSESDQKRLYALEKKIQRFEERFNAYCLSQERVQTHTLRQLQTQARATTHYQQAISLLQQASLAHEESKQDMQQAIEELQEHFLLLDQKQIATDEGMAAFRSTVDFLIVQTVDAIRREQNELFPQEPTNRRPVVLRHARQRPSLRRSRAMDGLPQQHGGYFVSDSEGE